MRETFGKKLIENQVIRAKFLRMGRLIEPAWAMLELLTWLIEDGRKKSKESGKETELRIGGMTALVKVVATRCLEKCVREAQQIMGGLGYARGGKGGRYAFSLHAQQQRLNNVKLLTIRYRIEAISRDVRVMAVGE